MSDSTITMDVLTAEWARHLELPDVGPDGDFFDLGGDSMGALSLVLHLSERYGIEVPLLDFFDDPTPRGTYAALGPADAL